MVDRETIDVYDTRAAEYANLLQHQAPDAQLVAFMDLLPEGGAVLDLGCGPATASAHMRAAGFSPDPVDASAAMVILANETFNIGARVMRFDQIDATAAYDGVWANFSLLHAPRSDLPAHFRALANALRPSGVISVGMKTGTGEKRDALGRKYTYVTADELQSQLTNAGFDVIGVDTGKSRGLDGVIAPWVVVRARKTIND